MRMQVHACAQSDVLAKHGEIQLNILWSLLIHQLYISCKGIKWGIFCNIPSVVKQPNIPTDRRVIWVAFKTIFCLKKLWLFPIVDFWTITNFQKIAIFFYLNYKGTWRGEISKLNNHVSHEHIWMSHPFIYIMIFI